MHLAASLLPTLVEPVNVNFRTLRSASRTSPIGAGAPQMTLSAPAGIPASSPNSANAKAVNGVNSDGFKMTVQPDARAGASFRVTIAAGKFQITLMLPADY